MVYTSHNSSTTTRYITHISCRFFKPRMPRGISSKGLLRISLNGIQQKNTAKKEREGERENIAVNLLFLSNSVHQSIFAYALHCWIASSYSLLKFVSESKQYFGRLFRELLERSLSDPIVRKHTHTHAFDISFSCLSSQFTVVILTDPTTSFAAFLQWCKLVKPDKGVLFKWRDAQVAHVPVPSRIKSSRL